MSVSAENLKTISKYPDIVIYNDLKSTATNGGTFTSGAWRVRDLNNTVYSNQTGETWASLSANTITLQPGVYYIKSRAPSYAADRNISLLRDITNNVDAALGTSSYCQPASSRAHNYSMIFAVIEVTSPTDYQLWHRCQTTRSTNGLGVGYGNIDGQDHVFTFIEIRKLE